MKNQESKMSPQILNYEALVHALHLRDLTDPQQGAHAMQQIIGAIHTALAERWKCRRHLHRACPIVAIEDNYDQLDYPAGGAARDARYTRYVTDRMLLRTQTSAMIPGLLRELVLDPPDDLLLICPGLVYRRDVVDRLHTGEPHQLDLWRVKRGRLTGADLRGMIAAVVDAALPEHRYRIVDTNHPYTTNGMQIDVEDNGEWIEIGECGLAAPAVLARAGLDIAQITGLAMGLGLDRILMLRKGIEDIRLLRSNDPRIAKQMLDLAPYLPVSNQPPIRRDLSIAIAQELTAEELGDRIREAMRDHLEDIESVEILDEASYENLPPAAHARMGMRPGQKNVLLRLVIRACTRTLTSAEANVIRDGVYRALHQGECMELAAPS
jgi:phenylalanyl-tRNA synthetase alpha chain